MTQLGSIARPSMSLIEKPMELQEAALLEAQGNCWGRRRVVWKPNARGFREERTLRTKQDPKKSRGPVSEGPSNLGRNHSATPKGSRCAEPRAVISGEAFCTKCIESPDRRKIIPITTEEASVELPIQAELQLPKCSRD